MEVEQLLWFFSMRMQISSPLRMLFLLHNNLENKGDEPFEAFLFQTSQLKTRLLLLAPPKAITAENNSFS